MGEKYKAYPEYKDSGVEWLGSVPEHWQITRLKHLAQIKNGQDYKTVEASEGFPVLGSGGQFTHATNFLYDKESVLPGRKGTIDKPLCINEPFWTVDTMYYTEINDDVPAMKTLFKIKHGYAFDGKNFSDSGQLILMTPGNFHERGGFRRASQEKYYSGTDFPEDFILEPGQLLIAMTEQAPGLLGCSLFVPEKGTYLHNQHLGLINPISDTAIDKQYLFHLLNSKRYRAEVGVSSTGQKVKHTSPEKILSIKLWLPSLAKQKSIANFSEERL